MPGPNEKKEKTAFEREWDINNGVVTKESIVAKALAMQRRFQLSKRGAEQTVEEWKRQQARMGASETEINQDPL